MDRVTRLAASRMVRFGLAGLANTAATFIVLNAGFYALHLPKLLSSIIATSTAVGLSFILNRSFVFGSYTHTARKLPKFIAVSAAGVLLVQNTVFALCIAGLRTHETSLAALIAAISGIRFSASFVGINLSNTIATLAVMVWNYNGYKSFVFKEAPRHEEAVEIETA